MEREIIEAIGLGWTEVVLEPKPRPEPQLAVTIYDFGNLLTQNEPPKKQR